MKPAPSQRLRSAPPLTPELAHQLYGERGLVEIAELTTPARRLTQALDARLGSLADIDVLFTGWGCPPIGDRVFAIAPLLASHHAGALGAKCLRLGHLMIEEFKRWQ